MARAAVPIFSPSCGSTRMIAGPPPLGRAVGLVFENHALGSKLISDAIGIGKTPLLASEGPFGHAPIDLHPGRFAAAQPIRCSSIEDPEQSTSGSQRPLQVAAL